MLHVVKKSPFASHSLEQCLRYITSQDQLLLIEDAVIAAVDNQMWQTRLQQAGVLVYALREDVQARALLAKVSVNINLVDTAGFVELTEKNQNILSW